MVVIPTALLKAFERQQLMDSRRGHQEIPGACLLLLRADAVSKPLNQLHRSFQMKAALPFANRVAYYNLQSSGRLHGINAHSWFGFVLSVMLRRFMRQRGRVKMFSYPLSVALIAESVLHIKNEEKKNTKKD